MWVERDTCLVGVAMHFLCGLRDASMHECSFRKRKIRAALCREVEQPMRSDITDTESCFIQPKVGKIQINGHWGWDSFPCTMPRPSRSSLNQYINAKNKKIKKKKTHNKKCANKKKIASNQYIISSSNKEIDGKLINKIKYNKLFRIP